MAEHVLKLIEDLTPNVLSDLLKAHYGLSAPRVVSLETRPIDEGVLSQVVEVSVTYAEGYVSLLGTPFRSESSCPPRGFVAKFNRRDMPQDRMFEVEGSFYGHHAGALAGCPFRIPDAIYCSSDCIILERVQDVVGGSMRHYGLREGCPVEETDALVEDLAAMHAHFWGLSGAAEMFEKLNETPGMGMALSGLTKEMLFASRWREYLDHASDCGVNPEEMDVVRSICRRLSECRLREVHDRVVQFRPTLIHGDFHVANMLFPPVDTNFTKNENEPVGRCCWLLDWAACGAGNPLFDLTFFFVVSTVKGAEDPLETERLLRLYHDTLTDSKTSDKSAEILDELPYHRFLDMYRMCVLNEFLILVAYDRLSRKFIDATQEPVLRKERQEHFNNVNRRCMRALISPVVDFDSCMRPPAKTEADLLAEQEALAKGDLMGMDL